MRGETPRCRKCGVPTWEKCPHQKRPMTCGHPEPDEMCMDVFLGGCLECERLHAIWSPIRERLDATIHKANAVEFAIQSESEARLEKLKERVWKEAWAGYKVVLAKAPKARRNQEVPK